MKRRIFDKEFKLEAVKLVREQDDFVPIAARDTI
jgi:transposase-like protein